jgi:N-acetylglutamate synthase
MQIDVVPFTIDVYDDVLVLWAQAEGVGLHDHSDSWEGIESYLTRNPGLSFVARAGGAVVGAALAGHDGRRGYLHHLTVHPDYRRQGIGRRLVDRCLGALQEAGIPKCHLFIFTDNVSGIAFWESVGWTPRNDLRIVSKIIDQKGL